MCIRDRKQGVLAEFAVTSNPIDLTGSATTEMYEESLELLLEDPKVDGVVLIALHHVPGIPDIEDFVIRLVNIVKQHHKPVTVCVIGGSEAAMFLRRRFEEEGVPAYVSPERAVRAFKALVTYGEYLRRTKS